jgi:hypothetical protein
MTPEQELARIKSDFSEREWSRLETIPEFQKALAAMDFVRAGEIAHREVRGNFNSASVARKFKDYY